MSEVTIGDVAGRAGIATSAIRYWEDQGLLDQARRRGGRRVYDESMHDRVALILLAQRAGFTIVEIRTLLRGFPPRASAGDRWRSLVGRKRTEVRERIDQLRRMLEVLDLLEGCECPDLDACGAAVGGRGSSGPEPRLDPARGRRRAAGTGVAPREVTSRQSADRR